MYSGQNGKRNGTSVWGGPEGLSLTERGFRLLKDTPGLGPEPRAWNTVQRDGPWPMWGGEGGTIAGAWAQKIPVPLFSFALGFNGPRGAHIGHTHRTAPTLFPQQT
eukprot:CAMPEP_0174323942 /NCGR_PEP_ID=MMETSP0810-20121108/12157_1 /TAXON_ID=73025 ORGANISM="Eutreptiella gymnastica-like, Strain CCMP1594" /NCGR_SAMPLE_ID=MMETSP0810 /ASSEMBLY_ACC=CAM_ASM_000659 /LENGTH=105 /DNA_ID=CAMNT_0015436565 /DNA_START=1090 /DNA_END=1407 /DNA_ORIENTATION=+